MNDAVLTCATNEEYEILHWLLKLKTKLNKWLVVRLKHKFEKKIASFPKINEIKKLQQIFKKIKFFEKNKTN